MLLREVLLLLVGVDDENNHHDLSVKRDEQFRKRILFFPLFPRNEMIVSLYNFEI